MSVPVPEPDTPTAIDPVQDPPIDPSTDDRNGERLRDDPRVLHGSGTPSSPQLRLLPRF